MKTASALIALACGFAAAPALSQSLSLGEVQQRGPAQPSREQAIPAPGPHPDANQGRFVAMGGQFGSLRTACTQCHQLDGAGDPSGAFPRLTDQSAWYLYSALRDFADGKRPNEVMTPIAKELTDGQMQDVAAFYASQHHVGHPPPIGESRQAVQQGQSLAQTGTQNVPGCDSCHGQNGVGNPPIYPYLAGQYELYLESQLKAFKAGARKGDPMGIMQSIAKQLTDAQIKDVSAYYASLSPQQVTPGELPTQSSSAAGEPRGRSAQSQAEQNGASNAESVQHVGATPNPQPQKGTTVVPGTPSAPPNPKPQ